MYQAERFLRRPEEARTLVDAVCGDAPPRLISAKFKISARCNLRCIACSYWKGKEPERVTTELALETLDRMRALGCEKVHFSGGEIFLRPDVFEILEHAVALGIRVNLTTNGTLLDREKAERLARSGVKSVALSIDGADAKTHDGIRGVKGAWKKTLKGLERLVKAREKTRSKLKIRINTLVCRKNYRELHHLVELLRAYPLMSLLLIPVDEKNSTDVGLNKARIQEYNDTVAPALADRALALGLFESVDEAYCFGRGADALRSASRGRYALGFFEEHLCYVPWTHTFVSPNADVYLCCMTRNRIVPAGNLHEAPFDAIWHGERLGRIRRRMIHERFPICHKCDNFLRENRRIDEAVGELVAKRILEGTCPPPLPDDEGRDLLLPDPPDEPGSTPVCADCDEGHGRGD